MTHPLDALTLANVPLLAVPRFGELLPITTSHRLLMAGNGVWLELKREWLHVRTRLATVKVAVPYGDIPSGMLELAPATADITASIRAFTQDAKQYAPLEHAALLVFNRITGKTSLCEVDITRRTEGRCDYVIPPLGEDECLIGDIHSHGHTRAFFSSRDDRDDADSVKLAIVVGDLNRDAPSVTGRLCLLGHYINLPQMEAALND
jgi:PRTRC genetic system protein A